MDMSKRVEAKTWDFVTKIQNESEKPIYDLPVEEGRAIFNQLQDLPANKSDVTIENKSIPFGSNGKVEVRIIRPDNVDEPLPVIIFFHGAGWVFGGYQTHSRLVRELAIGVRAAIVFVEYTLAPEAKYPTQIEECYAAMEYVAKQGEQWHLDTSRLAVAGDSVGGNMASVMTLLAKERKGAKIDYQVLMYPVTDANFDNDSYREFAEGPWLTKPAMEWFWDNYLPDKEKRKEIYASPLQASVEQLKGLPPALVITGECDVLRDEGEAYAHKLNEAGVTVTAVRHLSTIHDFLMLNELAETPACRNAVKTMIEHFKSTFSNQKW